MLNITKKFFFIFSSFIIIFFGYFNNITFASSGDLSSSGYMIDTNNLGLGGNNFKKETVEKTIDNTLSIIITKMIIGFGFLSVFVITIGGGFMVIAGGKEEVLTKGKSILKIGTLSLIIALSSGIIMKLVIYLLY